MNRAVWRSCAGLGRRSATAMRSRCRKNSSRESAPTTREATSCCCWNTSPFTRSAARRINRACAALRIFRIRSFPINRGGQATYHGPGQLVGYPIIDLRRYEQDLHRYLRWIEDVLIELLAGFDVDGADARGAHRRLGRGSQDRVHRRGRSPMDHDARLRVECVRAISRPSTQIVPCGIANVTMTSIEKESGKRVDGRRRSAARESNLSRADSASSRNKLRRRALERRINRMIPLEDTAADIIGKAQRGLAISDSQLAERAGDHAPTMFAQLRDGQLRRSTRSRAIAPILGLDADSLLKLAHE